MRPVLAAGVSREQIEDALAVCFAFNTMGRLADAFEFFLPGPKAWYQEVRVQKSAYALRKEEAAYPSTVLRLYGGQPFSVQPFSNHFGNRIYRLLIE